MIGGAEDNAGGVPIRERLVVLGLARQLKELKRRMRRAKRKGVQEQRHVNRALERWLDEERRRRA